MKLSNLLNTGTPVFLAPMAGVTDAPFREIVMKFGATAVVTEMVSSEALVRNNKKTFNRIINNNDIRIVQIVGADPYKMAESAKINEAYGADIIDINMGCPAKKIVNNDSGSALMRNEKLAVSIVSAVVKAVNIPVTLKMRLGWDNEHKNFLKLAKLFENEGIRMLSIHCRTRNQMYSGKANWKEISELSNFINIPYLCNGDIKTIDDATQALDMSKASGIMIGRASLGKPWLLQQIREYLNNNYVITVPTEEEKYKTIMEHFYNTLTFYGEAHGLRIFRKHFCWYSGGMKDAANFREKINNLENINEIVKLVDDFYKKFQN